LGAILALLILPMVFALPARAMVLTDALGRQVAVTTPVRRIVALNSDALEILRTLKAQNRVVGVSAEIVREPLFWGRRLTDLPKTGGWRTPNLEAIADLDPDLVLTYSRNPGADFDRKMADLGIPVLRLDFYKLATLEAEVRKIGRLLGEEDEARAFCDWYSGHLAQIRKRVAAVPYHPAVYIESYSDLATVGPMSGAHEMCLLVGGRNIAADTALPYPKVTPEWVVAQNPEIIVKAAAWGNGYQARDAAFFNELRDAIMARALAQEPDYLLLDEPTSSLDLYHQLEVMEMVAALVRNKTMGAIAAMHDLTLAGRFADDLLMMQNGAVFCHGRPADLLTAGTIREVYGVEAAVRQENGHVFVHPLQCAGKL